MKRYLLTVLISDQALLYDVRSQHRGLVMPPRFTFAGTILPA